MAKAQREDRSTHVTGADRGERSAYAPIHVDHGHSVSAWVTVLFLLLAALCVAIGVAFGLHPFYYAGAALAVLGLVVGKILGATGFGPRNVTEPPPLSPEEQAQLDAQQAR